MRQLTAWLSERAAVITCIGDRSKVQQLDPLSTEHQATDRFRKTGLRGQSSRPPRFPEAPRPPLRGASRRDAASAFLVTLLIEKQM